MAIRNPSGLAQHYGTRYSESIPILEFNTQCRLVLYHIKLN